MVRPSDPVNPLLGIQSKERLLKKKKAIRKKDICCIVISDGKELEKMQMTNNGRIKLEYFLVVPNDIQEDCGNKEKGLE